MNEEKQRIPISGTFELTGRCNLACKMCLIRMDQGKNPEGKKREKTAEEWIDMARQAKDAGTLGLLLTGGEVMLRQDFCEIYEAIAQMGFLLTLYTNATMITDEIMDVLKRYPPHQIGVTMYGASNQTYEKLCESKNGYDRFVEGMKKLSKLPSLLEMRTTIVKENRKDLSAMQDFTKEYFGENQKLQISRFVTKSIRGGAACAEKSRLTPAENIRMVYHGLAEIHQKVQTGKLKLPEAEHMDFPSHKMQLEGQYLFQHCSAGIDQYAIAWDGNMYGCELMAEGYTEPFQMGFQEAWRTLPDQYPKSQIIRECAQCSARDFCETCPAIRLAETGDWFGIPDYFCKEAKYIRQMASDLGVLNKVKK